jgi:hypothetical protein
VKDNDELSKIEKILINHLIGYSSHVEYSNEELMRKQTRINKSRYFARRKYWAKVRKVKINNGNA